MLMTHATCSHLPVFPCPVIELDMPQFSLLGRIAFSLFSDTFFLQRGEALVLPFHVLGLDLFS